MKSPLDRIIDKYARPESLWNLDIPVRRNRKDVAWEFGKEVAEYLTSIGFKRKAVYKGDKDV